jgi:glutamate/aspartate transport system permease protein
MLPSLITQSIVTFQDTSLAFVIGLNELVRRASIVDNMEVRSIELYGFRGLGLFHRLLCGVARSVAFYEKSRKDNISMIEIKN